MLSWKRKRVMLIRSERGIQSMHHGNDHRTHVGSILGHHSLTYGEMDVRAYAEATGAIVQISAKA